MKGPKGSGDMVRMVAVFGLLLMLAAPPLAAQTPGPDAAGSTVIGDEEEAAIGLVLRPWREEAMSDVDRPPRALDLRPQLLSVEEVEARASQYEVLREFQRTQTQRR